MQQQRCLRAAGTRAGYSCGTCLQHWRAAPSRSLQVRAAASVELNADVGVHAAHIAPDATKLIGNTPMVSAGHAQSAAVDLACRRDSSMQLHTSNQLNSKSLLLLQRQVYLNSVTKQGPGCYARVACKLELMQPCCRCALVDLQTCLCCLCSHASTASYKLSLHMLYFNSIVSCSCFGAYRRVSFSRAVAVYAVMQLQLQVQCSKAAAAAAATLQEAAQASGCLCRLYRVWAACEQLLCC
jgi:hypothetical protein